MNLPIKLPPRPSPLSADVSRSLAVSHAAVEEIGFQRFRFTRPEPAPSAGLRQELEIRAVALDSWLAPASQRVIDAEITSIFALMAVKDISEEDREREMRLWRNDLLRAGLSTFGLTEACAKFRLGDAGDSKGKFAPKVGEVVQEARAIERLYRKERSEIKAVLTAEIPAPIDEARRNAVLEEYWKVVRPALQAATIPGDLFPRKKPPPPDVRFGEIVPAPVPDNRPLPMLSEEAQAKLSSRPYVETE